MDSKLEQLPVELVRQIRGYVYRFDWRTCKKREASLVASLFQDFRAALWFKYWVLFKEDVTFELTLFGLFYLFRLPINSHFALGRPPLIPPNETRYREDYTGWYKHLIQWING